MTCPFCFCRQGKCVQSAPVTLEPAPSGKASEWQSKTHHTVSMKVVYTDYDNVAIIHECNVPNDDGSCPLEHRHIDVLSRDPESPREGTRQKVAPYALQLCLRRRDFKKTSKAVICEIVAKEEKHCNNDDLPLQEDLNPYMLLGEWFSYARMKGTLAIDSSKYLVTRADSYGSRLRMFYTGTRKGQCIIGGQSFMEARTDEPSKFTLTYMENGELNTGELTVLYADDNHALIHECYNVKSDGSCDKADTYVEIISRNKTLGPGSRQHIIDALYKACFTLGDLVLSLQEVDCNIPIPGKSCGFNNVRLHPDFDYRSIMGKTWFAKARVVPGAAPIWSDIGHYEIFHVDSDTVQFAWAASEYIGNGTAQCIKGLMNMDRLGSDATLVGKVGRSTVQTKILFADDDLTVIFDCKMNGTDCPVDGREIVINQRNRVTPLTPAAINFVKDVIRTQTCEDPEKLELLDVPDPCPSPSRDKVGRLCYQDTITAQENLDLTKISGLWFQVARADTAEDINWDAGVFHLSIVDPKTVRIQFTGRSRYDEDSCLPVYVVDAYPDTRQPAYMVFASERFRGKNGLMKIVHSDDDLLVIYECLPGGQQENGLCKRSKEHVEVYARKTGINSENFKKVREILHEKTCFSDFDLVMSNRTIKCPLPDHEDVRHSAKSCNVRDYPAAENIDYKSFSGLWYEIERTQYQDTAVKWTSTAGNLGKLWEAAVLYYDAIRDDVFNYTYTGYTLRDGNCQGPFVAHTHPAPGETARSGHLHIFPGHTDAHGGPWVMHGVHKIVWTNYDEAVVYICFGQNDDGTCRKNREFVSIISRNTEIGETKLHDIHNIIKTNLCIDLSGFVQPHRDYDKCLSTLGIEYESSGDGDENLHHKCSGIQCKMACPHGFKKDEHGCEICDCIGFSTEDEGSGSGSEIVQVKEELGSGADEMVKTESSGEEPKKLSQEETELLNEIENLNLIGH